MRRILWASQDLIDWALNHLNEERRWSIIGFLMDHGLLDCCRVQAYFWATCIGDDSIFDLPRRGKYQDCPHWKAKA